MKLKGYIEHIGIYTILVALLSATCITQAGEGFEGLSPEPGESSESTEPSVSTGQVIMPAPPIETIEQSSADQPSTTTASSPDTSSSESPITTLDTKPSTTSITFAPGDELTQVSVYKKASATLADFIDALISKIKAPFQKLYSLLPNFTLSSGSTSHDVLNNLRSLLDSLNYSVGNSEDLTAEITKVASELEEVAAKAQAQDPNNFDKADFDELRQTLEEVAKEVYNSDLATLAANEAQSALSSIPQGSLPESVIASYKNFLDTLNNPVVKQYSADQINALADVKEQAKALLDPFRSQLGDVYRAFEQASQEASPKDKASFDTLEESARVLAQKYYGVDIELLTPDASEATPGNWQNELENTQASLTQLNTIISEMPSSLAFAKGKARDVQGLVAEALSRVETATTPADRLKALFSLRKAISEVNAFQNYLSGKITPPEGQEAEAQELKVRYQPALEAQQQLTQAVSSAFNTLLAKLPNTPELEDQVGNVERVQSLLANTTQRASSLLSPIPATTPAA